MFPQKCRAYDYRNPSILTLPKYNTNTHGKKCFMYGGAKLWNSISMLMLSKQQIFQNLKHYLEMECNSLHMVWWAGTRTRVCCELLTVMHFSSGYV